MLSGDALQLVAAPVTNRELPGRKRVTDCREEQDFAVIRRGHDSRSGAHLDAAHLLATHLAFPQVDRRSIAATSVEFLGSAWRWRKMPARYLYGSSSA
jgi:hypothetical protein